MTRLRDSQRSKVYAAEGCFFPMPALRVRHGYYTEPVPVRKFQTQQEMRDFVHRVELSEFWQTRACFAARSRRVDVRFTGERRGRATYQHNRITHAAWTCYDEYVLHELAHLAVGVQPILQGEEAAHGPSFVRMLHDLIAEFMGQPAADAFRAGCQRTGAQGLSGYRGRVTPAAHEYPLAAGPQRASHDPLAAFPGYADSYRKYKLGERASAPKPRNGMTPADVAAIRIAVDQEL